MSKNLAVRARKIYLASSWRNPEQPALVLALRAAGHEVYDFRNPAPGNTGFAWDSIDKDWLNWSPEKFAELLKSSPVAAKGFSFDKAALEWCDTCILALPCGRSAHLELGYAAGQGKDTYVLLREDKFEPELMYLLNTACASTIEEIISMMGKREPLDIPRWHTDNGGNFNVPGSHAVRLLREVVELCLASGARVADIQQHVAAEINRQVTKPEFNPKGNPDDLPEEWADCQILLDVFAHHAGIDKNMAVRDKVDVLWAREWQSDQDGVLWRPAVKLNPEITVAKLEKRKWHYRQRPNVFEIASCSCGSGDTQWSEFERHLWCESCKKDFIPQHNGVFNGPIPIQAASMFGISFDRVNLETKKIEKYNTDSGQYEVSE